MGNVSFHVLGGVTARRGGEDLALGGPKQRLLLALLLTNPQRLCSADRLVEGVWTSDPPSDPRRSLQVYVSRLRQAVGNDVRIEHRDGGYLLDVAPERIDAGRFAELADQGVRLVEDDPRRSATVLRDALAHWQGRPFGALGEEPGLAAEVTRLEELRTRALEARVDADLALGLHADLLAELEELTATYPLRERFWAQRIQALYRSGRQAEALAAYEAARSILADELGIDPSPFLQELHTRVLRQDPQLDTPPAGPASGPVAPATRRVRGYELLEEIGSGGFGVVYRGRQAAVDRDVAVKVIRPELADDPAFVRRFEVEAQTIAQLEHLHIVPLYDYWREPGAAYLVMRWLRGGSLAQALRRGPWDLGPAAEVVGQIASALDVAHRHGVAHLDVKPANVLLDEHDNAYLSDFGIARGIGQPPVSTDSVPYLTPEHVTDAPKTSATDVFGLGLLAFELLTGQHPYDGESPDTLRARVLRRPLPDLRDVRMRLPGHVEDALLRATAVDPDERFSSASALAEAIGPTTRVARSVPGRRDAARNPYKGLRAFQESDAGDFFGRERLVDDLLGRLGGTDGRARFIAVVGPSGSGKSSVVRAGLVPALRAGRVADGERWFVTTMLPGTAPAARLERALVEVALGDPAAIRTALDGGDDGLCRAVGHVLPDDGSELVLVVDQFEELFSLSDEGERARFARLLHTAVMDPASRVRVVVTLRADFYDHPLLDARLGELVATGTVPVSTLTPAELERAITGPARAVGVRLHWDLVTQVVNDVGETPGGLPLLQYALTELFEQRTEERLTLEAYRAIGGVHGALAGRAEALYASLDRPAQQACRQLFLRLVAVGEGTTTTRHRVSRAELTGSGDVGTVDHVLEQFGRHRLLTFDHDDASRAPTVEVAHEALLDAWGRLRGWIDGAREDLLVHRRLRAAADEWVAVGRDDDHLLTGARLRTFEQWAPTAVLPVTTDEQALLEASRAAEAARQAREDARAAREQRLERRSIRWLQVAAGVSAVAAVVAVGLSLFAFGQRDQAQIQERIATARGLAAAAVAELETDPERGVLLAMEAVELTRQVDGEVLPEAETALRRTLMASHVERRIPGGGSVSVAADGGIATLSQDGTLSVWPRAADAPQLELPAHRYPHEDGTLAYWLAALDDIDIAADGEVLVASNTDLEGAVRDLTTGEVTTRLDGRLLRPRFAPDDATLAAIVAERTDAGWTVGSTIGIWDATTGQVLQRLEGHAGAVHDHAFSPDGTRLAAVDATGGLWMWELATGEPAWHLPADEDHPPVLSVAFHPSGDRLATGAGTGPVLVRDSDDGAMLASLTGHRTHPRAVDFSPDGQQLVSASNESARVWDLDTGTQLFALRGHTAPLQDALFTPDGERIVTTSEDDTTRVWDVRVAGGREYAALATGLPPEADLRTQFSPDGQLLATAGPDGTVLLWDVATLEVARTLHADLPVSHVAFSGDGTTIVTASTHGYPFGPPEEWRDQIDLWDATTGDHLTTIDGLDQRAWHLTISDDGSTIVHAGHAVPDGQLRAIDADTGQELFRYIHPAGPVYHVAFTPDERRLVVGAQDAGLLLDATTGEVLDELEVERSLFGADFATDGTLVTSEVHGLLQVRDPDTGEVVRTLGQQSGPSFELWDDQLALTGAGALAVLDVDTGRRRFEVDYRQPAKYVAVSPDGRYLATIGELVHLHVVRIDDLLDLAGDRVTRTLTGDECHEFLGRAC